MTNLELAMEILKKINGSGNVDSYANCMTRLRIKVKNLEKVDFDGLKKIDGVLGVIQNETVQVVIGPGKVKKVADEFGKLVEMKGGTVEESSDVKHAALNENLAKETKDKYKKKQNTKVHEILKIVGNIFVPLIPGFVSSGLILGISNVIANMATAGVIDKGVINASWFILLKTIGGLLFGALGVFTGINAAKEFGGTGVIGGIAGLLIYSPALTQLKTFSIFGFNLQIATGLGGVLGVILAAYIFSVIEKYLRKYIPDSLDLMITPLVTILVGSFITIAIIMPLSGFIMNAITWFLVDFCLYKLGALGGYILSATFLPLVTVGLHQGLTPVHLQLIEKDGFTTLLPVLAMAGAGQVGTAIAIYVKTKDKSLKNRIASALPVGFLGIGEPLIYGVSLPLGRPFISACIGAGFGGAWCAIYKLGAIAVGPSGLALIPLVAQNKYLAYFIGLLISYVAGFIITYFWGFKEEMVERLYD
ncbi:PTS transporter subunit EIIC [Clostridium sp. YIM B02551]|uniref:PTS transporter subunit EIIC n=1 Tax=Clostridium sp. YIM B02551 TaxID=2910679 RepID=UPI001EEC5248|nr:PTS transporter subunit EIIC [Clostridium sp. YIM B02551]